MCLYKVVASHPRVSEKMKMRCFLINRDNVRTYRLLQNNFQVDLNTLFYMGKMNLLHISCDIGWSSLAEELVLKTGMEVEQRCPSLHMRPASLTPLMLAAGAGHTKVVAALLQSEVSVDTEAKDGYGMTALFHTCNHGLHRVRLAVFLLLTKSHLFRLAISTATFVDCGVGISPLTS